MTIRRKSSIDKKNYELSGQMSFFGRDNLNFKSVTLLKVQRYVDICKKFRLKKIILQKKKYLPFLEI